MDYRLHFFLFETDIYSCLLFIQRNKPNKFFMPHKNNTPVTNHFQMSSPLSAERKNSFFLLGELNDISYLSKKYHGKLIKEFNVTFNSEQLKLYEINFK